MAADAYRPEELVELVTWLAEKKYGYDSTSISYEAAEALMDAVWYCLRTYEKMEAVLLEQRGVSARQAYQIGYRQVVWQAEQVRRIYQELLPRFQSYGLCCLEDTIRKGIPAFLRYYDARFRPQETLLTLDYPVLLECGDRTGVALVLRYLNCIVLEQRFLARFPPAYVVEALSAYHADYAVLIENICSILLGNLFGHWFLQKPLSQKGFCQQEYARIKAQLGTKPKEILVQTMNQILAALVAEQYDNDTALLQYLQQETANLAVRIQTGLASGRLEQIFLV